MPCGDTAIKKNPLHVIEVHPKIHTKKEENESGKLSAHRFKIPAPLLPPSWKKHKIPFVELLSSPHVSFAAHVHVF